MGDIKSPIFLSLSCFFYLRYFHLFGFDTIPRGDNFVSVKGFLTCPSTKNSSSVEVFRYNRVVVASYLDGEDVNLRVNFSTVFLYQLQNVNVTGSTVNILSIFPWVYTVQ